MILWFSGTGNSRWVAEQLKWKLQDTDCYPMGRNRNFCIDELIKPGDNLIWVFPVYSWGVPPFVRTALKTLSIIKSAPVSEYVHHCVMTCGDDVGNAARQWRRLLKQYGWTQGGVWSVQMPNNYVCMKGFDVDPIALQQQKIEAARLRVQDIGEIIKSGQWQGVTDVVRGRFAWFKTSVINPWFRRYAMSAKPFKVDRDKCTKCLHCMDKCQANAILTDSDGYPMWQDKCAMCLRCYHECPRHAISYGNKTEGKGHYKFPEKIHIDL